MLFALGFTLIFDINNILNLAHGAVLMAGAFFALFLVLTHELPLEVALIAAAVFAGLLSVLDSIAFQPLRRRES